jgi:hypothetical protein
MDLHTLTVVPTFSRIRIIHTHKSQTPNTLSIASLGRPPAMAGPHVHEIADTELPSSSLTRYAFPFPMYMKGQRCTWTETRDARKQGHMKTFKIGCKGKITDIYNCICPGHGLVAAWHTGRATSHRYQGQGGRGPSGQYFAPARTIYPESLDFFQDLCRSLQWPTASTPSRFDIDRCTGCRSRMWSHTKERGWVYWCAPSSAGQTQCPPPVLCSNCQTTAYKTQQLGVVCTHGYEHIKRCTACDTAPLQRVLC